jgi:hypothetical protein
MGQAEQYHKLDTEIVRRTLEGFAEVNRRTAAERHARLLQQMSDAEARRVLDDLVATYGHFLGDGPGWERLARARIERKLIVRRAFERLARYRSQTRTPNSRPPERSISSWPRAN